jgi:hypothetical protein
MLTHTNIDRRDSVVVSKAPFTYESTMTIENSVLPAGSFIAVKVYVEESYKVPFRFHSIQTDGKVWLCDSTGKLACYWQTYEGTAEIAEGDRPFVSSLLYKENGVVAGFISCTHTVVSLIRHIVESNTEALLLPSNAFILIPQCHTAMISGCCRSFAIINQKGTEYKTKDVYITGNTNDMIHIDDNTISISNSPATISSRAPVNTVCSVVVGGTAYDVSDKSIIIKAAMLSNLRVVKEEGTIRLIGVLNA